LVTFDLWRVDCEERPALLLSDYKEFPKGPWHVAFDDTGEIIATRVRPAAI
jgi:hypothetical protein